MFFKINVVYRYKYYIFNIYLFVSVFVVVAGRRARVAFGRDVSLCVATFAFV